jgi:hypothetical protein
MKKWYFISIATLLHAAIGFGLCLISFSIAMRRFDTGATLGFGEKALELLSKLFFFWPIYYPLFAWGPHWLTELFSGLLSYMPIFANSLVWGLAAWWLYSRYNKKIRTPIILS